MMLNLNDSDSVSDAIKETQKEIEVISRYGWGTWKSVYHSTLEEKYIDSYVLTLHAQIEHLTNRLKDL